MNTFTFQPTLELDTHRCFECGSYWAFERSRALNNMTCPRCAREQIDRANQRADEAERSKRSLKGAVTRINRKAK